jgi:hypothetical protein
MLVFMNFYAGKTAAPPIFLVHPGGGGGAVDVLITKKKENKKYRSIANKMASITWKIFLVEAVT